MKQTGAHPHIVFAGGGTGGHLFPGLAVAARLVEDLPSVRITFAGESRRLERELVAEAGFEYVALPCRPRPERLRDVLPFVAENVNGYREAARFLDREEVAAVVGLGGYASVPMARAAVRRGVPLVLLEQNAVPGRATRWLAPTAALVCTAFEQANPYLGRSAVRVTGNPVRADFAHRLAEVRNAAGNGRQRAPGAAGSGGSNGKAPYHLLVVLGGSRGARSLNQYVPLALSQMGGRLRGWKIVHQAGPLDSKAVRRLYARLGLKAVVAPFVANMPEVLSRADLAICRAGGTTLAELAVAGVPAILLPYPHAADDHQRKNADVFTASGGCVTLDERELPGRLDRYLVRPISVLLTNEAKRTAMSEAIARLAQPDATWDVATMVRQVAACGMASGRMLTPGRCRKP